MASKVVVITGATRGIGRGILEKFSKEDYSIICIYKNSHDLASELSKRPNIDCYACDISNYDDIKTISAQILAKYPKIDVLVNNAGISRLTLFTDETPESFSQMIDTNVSGTFNITHAFIKSMIAHKSGSIINISSMWGEVGASMEVAYSTAKGAIISFTKALAKEMGLSSIRVNCVTPGVIDTDMMASFSADDLSMLKDETPLSRLGTPEDIANAVYFLACDDSSFITGQVLGVSGGFII